MRAKIFFITLAVADLDRSVAFYRDGLGWPTEGIVGREFHDEMTGADGTIAFFTLDGGLMLGLYERANLAKDAGIPAGPASSTEFSLGVPAESQADADRMLAEVKAAGGTLTAPATCVRSGSTPAISPIPTVTCGRSPGTPTRRPNREFNRITRCGRRAAI